ncbi:MAG: hypothetical protein V1796_02775 [Pseudomonadota bacterium]
MNTNIIIEIFLAFVVSFAGRGLWQVLKRNGFVVSVMRDESILSNLISRSRLNSASPVITVWAQKLPSGNSGYFGYPVNIQVLIAADKGAERKMKIMSGFVLLGVVLGSYLLGTVYLAINVIIIFLSAIPGISAPTRDNALIYVMQLAVILDKWRAENATECEQWIDQAWSLRPLYNAVKTAR